MGNPSIGLRPCPDAKGQVLTRRAYVSSSNTIDLARGSAVYLSGGEILGTPAYTDGTESVTGAVVRCMTDDNKTVQNIPSSTDGYMVEFSYSPDQRYAVTVSGTGIAQADLGKYYSLTDETLTDANTDGFSGGGFSKRELDSTTEQTSGEQFIVHELSGSQDANNDYATDGAEVIVTINSANYVAG